MSLARLIATPLLVLVYVVVIVPSALVIALLRIDPLARRLDRGARSYWRPLRGARSYWWQLRGAHLSPQRLARLVLAGQTRDEAGGRRDVVDCPGRSPRSPSRPWRRRHRR